MPVRITEAGGTMTLDRRGTGRFLVQLINAGVGSSAEYTPAVLQLAEQQRQFAAGTHMYVDHKPIHQRTGSHGERSLHDLAAVLTSDAHYDDQTQALVAEAQAVGGYADVLESLAPHVGLSISATAEVDPPTAPGRPPLVREFVTLESVDWVTRAGRGGQVLAILESGRTQQVVEATSEDRRDQLRRAVRTTYEDRDRNVYAYVHDFDDVAQTVYYQVSDLVYAQPYEVAADDRAVTLTGERREVRPVTQFVPVASTAGVTETGSPTKEERMPDITQAELDRLHAQEAQLTAIIERAETAERLLAEAETAKQVAEARQQATSRVAEAAKDLPAPMRDRITKAIVAQVTESVPADLDQQITAAVDAERVYLASVTESGRLTGFGQHTTTESAPAKRTHNAFGRPIQEV